MIEKHKSVLSRPRNAKKLIEKSIFFTKICPKKVEILDDLSPSPSPRKKIKWDQNRLFYHDRLIVIC